MTRIKTKCAEGSDLGREGVGYKAMASGWALYPLMMPVSSVGGGNVRGIQQEAFGTSESFLPMPALLFFTLRRKEGRRRKETFPAPM